MRTSADGEAPGVDPTRDRGGCQRSRRCSKDSVHERPLVEYDGNRTWSTSRRGDLVAREADKLAKIETRATAN